MEFKYYQELRFGSKWVNKPFQTLVDPGIALIYSTKNYFFIPNNGVSIGKIFSIRI